MVQKDEARSVQASALPTKKKKEKKKGKEKVRRFRVF